MPSEAGLAFKNDSKHNNTHPAKTRLFYATWTRLELQFESIIKLLLSSLMSANIHHLYDRPIMLQLQEVMPGRQQVLRLLDIYTVLGVYSSNPSTAHSYILLASTSSSLQADNMRDYTVLCGMHVPPRSQHDAVP